MNTTQIIIDVIIPAVVQLIFGILTLAVFVYAMPWAKKWMQYGIIRWLVNAAEKKAEAGTIDKDMKKQYVIRLMEYVKIPVNEFTMAMLESAVKQLDLLEDKVRNYLKDENLFQNASTEDESDFDLDSILYGDTEDSKDGAENEQAETAADTR